MEILAFILYFATMLGIGLFFFFKDKSTGEKDYFLGGRKMGPFVTAMSAQASDMSGWLLMGLPGSIIAFGMGKAWIGIGLGIGTILNWVIVAARLRRFSKASGDSITLPQYLTNRFATANPALKVICAVIFLISFTVYVASAFNAGTAVFIAVIPWFKDHQMLAMIIFAAIVLVYTFLGGYKAVCWTDFFQGLLMLIALLAVPIVMVVFGNFDTSFMGEFSTGVSSFNSNLFDASAKDIISGLGWGLGYFGMPHILVRFMSINKAKKIKTSASVAIVWVILTLGAAALIAYLGRTYLLSDGSSLAASILPDAKETIFIKIVVDLFPAFIAGLLLSAIIAASMSTADSQLLVASSSFTSDIYKPIIRKNKASDKEILWVGRIVVLIVSIIGFVIASSGLNNPGSWASSIMNMVENAWGLFGAAFGPVIILSLFWKRFNYAGAVAGILAGAIVDICWLVFINNAYGIIETLPAYLESITGIYEIVPGFAIGFIVSVIVTLITKRPSAEVEKIFATATDTTIDD